uniref:Squamosa promoter binding-like protein CNR n=1 Tax=Petunia hybrida TaxID=4102 RepID=A0A2K9ZXH2_PETHY|nr:squamosa promoter binding-like protein CNR [Petunia x hybrida]
MEINRWEGKRSMNDVEEEEDDDNLEEDNKRKRVLILSERKLFGGGPAQPSCQVEQCTADMADVKPYYRRHKVCQFHSKASVILISGLQQRFCQQ